MDAPTATRFKPGRAFWYAPGMLPRAMTVTDLALLTEIDSTVHSDHYSHLNRTTDETSIIWRLERRALREKLVSANRISDELEFSYRQIVSGIDDGLAACIEINGTVVASMLAQQRADLGTLALLDLRVDYDFRRQGLGMSLACAAISLGRDQALRAISAETPSQNDPAAQLLKKLGFEPAGLDAYRRSNHDLVKEDATLLWCLPLE